MQSFIIQNGRKVKDVYRQATYPLRILPDFIIPGVQKCGTTSLYNYLIEHPNIISARRKEINFFDEHYQKGTSWYRAQFPTAMQKYYVEHIRKQDFITGEASPQYLLYPHTAEKVARLVPQAKIIILLRDPVERAYSHYRHNRRMGHETLSFEEAIDLEEERTREGKKRAEADENFHDFRFQRASYLGRGIYIDQLPRWMSIFPREQFLIIHSEDLFAAPAEVFKQTLSFLDVPVFEPEALKKGYKQHNKAKDTDTTSKKIEPAVRKRLIEYFAPYNERLYTFLGVDFGWER